MNERGFERVEVRYLSEKNIQIRDEGVFQIKLGLFRNLSRFIRGSGQRKARWLSIQWEDLGWSIRAAAQRSYRFSQCVRKITKEFPTHD